MTRTPPSKDRTLLYPEGPNRVVNQVIRDLGGLRAAADWFHCSDESIRNSVKAGRFAAQRALWLIHCFPGKYDPLDLSPRTQDIPEHLRVDVEGEE